MLILYPFFAALSWILQSFVDKEILKSVSIQSYILFKMLTLGILILISIFILNLIYPNFIKKIKKDYHKNKNNKKILKNLLFVSLIGLGSMVFHYVGYKNFKISKFVTLETIFSIILSVLVGYYFFKEKLEKNELFGIFFAIISIITFYYKDIKLLLKK